MSVRNVLSHYSPEDMALILNAADGSWTHQVNGTLEGTFFSLERIIPHATLATGADASNARVIRNVRNYNLTVSLMQTSESNDVFSSIIAKDAETRDGSKLFSLILKDTIGRTVMSSPVAFIGTTPTLNYSTDIEGRDWVLSLINVQEHIGGNGFVLPDTQATLSAMDYEVDDQWRGFQID